ncbi:MAG: hypothetical protein MN733_40675, partial [Nitrososphaera sp.]|nr:hypothetical protein [Nitrososphaera sp.]
DVIAMSLNVHGALVARDDALMFNDNLFLNHDIRLLGDESQGYGLPLSVDRPSLVTWEECPSSGCP